MMWRYIQDPDNHRARSIPAKIQVTCLPFPAWMTPKLLMLEFWEDGPTLIIFSYWAFSPDSKHLHVHCVHVQPTPPELLCPISFLRQPQNPWALAWLLCPVTDTHTCAQAVDSRSSSSFQWLSTKEVKLLCTKNSLSERSSLTAGIGFPEKGNIISDLIFHF